MKPHLLFAAAVGLVLSACAQPQPARTVFLSGPGVHHVHTADGRSRVVVIRHPDSQRLRAEVRADARRHAARARAHATEARRLALLGRPDPSAMARIRREALDAGERARRQGEAARQQGEAARRKGEEARRRAERLREQCERGEIRCEIIITD